jgi:hypothetical protein
MTNHKESGADIEANRDPLTGEPGSHPIGTSAGSVGGAAAGAAVGGAIGGPVGAVIGGAIGAVAGGAAGHAAGEELDPTLEESYWRENFHRRPYYQVGTDYSDYEPAYRYGWENAALPSNRDRGFEAAEPELERAWAVRNPGKPWKKVRDASRDAWELTHSRRGESAEKT